MKKLSLLLLLIIPLFSRAQQAENLFDLLLEKMPGEIRGKLSLERNPGTPAQGVRPRQPMDARELLELPATRQPAWRGEEEVSVLDSFYTYQMIQETGQYLPVQRVFNTHDAMARLSRQLRQGYNQTDNSWRNEQYLQFEYDSLGRENIRVEKRWSSYFGEWQNLHQTLTYYNDKGHPVEKSVSWWHFPTSSWQEEERTLYTYGHLDRLTHLTTQLREDGMWKNQHRQLFSYSVHGDTLQVVSQIVVQPDAWVNNSRRSKGYDSDGNNFEHLFEYWDPDNGWLLSSREVYSYNQQHQLQEVILQYWSPWDSSWINSMRRSHDYNDLGKTSAIIQQYWEYGNQAWMNQEAYYLDYDEDGNLQDAYLKDWWPTEFGLRPQMRYLIDYTDSGDTSDLTYQHWNQALDDWENWFQISMRYDSAGQVAVMTAKTWDAEAASWRFDVRLVLTYAAPGLIGAIYEQTWDEDQQQWVNDARSVRQYDGQGRIIVLTTDHAMGTQDWVHQSRTLYEYDGDGKLGIMTMQYYQLPLGWVNSSRETFLYDGSNLAERTRHDWNLETHRWEAYIKYLYAYDAGSHLTEELRQVMEQDWRNNYRRLLAWDAYGRQTEEISQYWNGDTLQWQNDYRETWEYNSDGLEAAHTEYFWEISLSLSWIPIYREESHYDSLQQRTEQHGFHWSVDQWKLVRRLAYQYNAAGLMTGMEEEHLVPVAWDWSERQHHQYFWSKMVVNAAGEIASAGLDCFLQNPYPGGGPVRCEGLEAGREYELLLFSAGGMLVSSQRFVNGMSLAGGAGFSPGVYWMILRTGGRTVHAGKVVMGL